MPVIIKERPHKQAYRIDWPNDLDLCNEKIYTWKHHTHLYQYMKRRLVL